MGLWNSALPQRTSVNGCGNCYLLLCRIVAPGATRSVLLFLLLLSLPPIEKAALEANPSKEMMQTSAAIAGMGGLLLGMGVGVPPALLNSFTLAGAAGYLQRVV